MGKKVGEPIPEEIEEVAFFDELPKELSFPEVEYLEMLEKFKAFFDTMLGPQRTTCGVDHQFSRPRNMCIIR